MSKPLTITCPKCLNMIGVMDCKKCFGNGFILNREEKITVEPVIDFSTGTNDESESDYDDAKRSY